MKRILLLISLFAIMSFACDSRCVERLERIANSLERIANIMQKEYNMELNNKTTVRESYSATGKNYNVQINGRSLKAVPTVDDLNDEDKRICEEWCRKNFYFSKERKTCLEEKCGEQYNE